MLVNRDQEFEAFVRKSRARLLRVATNLTAGDPHLAEDLVQTTLVRLYVAWPRARRTHVDAYATRTLVNSLIDQSRRPYVRRERPLDRLPERATAVTEREDDADTDVLDALGTLAPRMRTAVVLRHVEGFSLKEAADAMNCGVGNVKSQASRGLDKIRAALSRGSSCLSWISMESSASRDVSMVGPSTDIRVNPGRACGLPADEDRDLSSRWVPWRHGGTILLEGEPHDAAESRAVHGAPSRRRTRRKVGRAADAHHDPPRVAALLGISRSAAYRCAASGDLPTTHLGGRVYVVTARLQELLESA
jgi:RNA polymerase sigma-70 factor (sigma-E family)